MKNGLCKGFCLVILAMSFFAPGPDGFLGAMAACSTALLLAILNELEKRP